MIFQAIKQNGMAYQFASNRLKQDEELKQLALEDDSITDKNKILEMFKWKNDLMQISYNICQHFI